MTKHDIEQGTITISNLGSIYRGWRGECTILKIIPPQLVAIGVGAAQQKPVCTPQGEVVSALISVKGIQKCLEKFRAQTVMLIIGMLIGSLYAIVMGPTTVDSANEMLNQSNFSILFFIIGIALIALLEFLKYQFEKKEV